MPTFGEPPTPPPSSTLTSSSTCGPNSSLEHISNLFMCHYQHASFHDIYHGRLMQLLHSLPGLQSTSQNISAHILVRLAGGFLAGVIAAAATYPLDLVRTRLAAQMTDPNENRSKKRRGRGPARSVRGSHRRFLSFDELGTRIGEERNNCGKKVWSCVKKMNINSPSYKDYNPVELNKFWEETKRKFNFEDDELGLRRKKV